MSMSLYRVCWADSQDGVASATVSRRSEAGNVIPLRQPSTPRTQHLSWCQTPSSPSYCTVGDRRSILLNRGCALDDILTALSAFPAGHQQDRTCVAVGQYSGGEDLSTIIDIRPAELRSDLTHLEQNCSSRSWDRCSPTEMHARCH